MNQTLKIIKLNFLLLLGMALFTYNLFNFNSSKHCESGMLPSLGCVDPVTYYYYRKSTLILLSIGAVLIAIGLLQRKKREDKTK
ncbi:MAG: hypothetical protein ACKKMO_01055 [Candidatus Nealsonbacteria bacterium]